MYLSQQGLIAIHQDVVNDAMRQAARRRILRESRMQAKRAARARNPWRVLRHAWQMRWSEP